MFVHNRTVSLALLGAGVVNAGAFSGEQNDSKQKQTNDVKIVLMDENPPPQVYENAWDIRVKQTVCMPGWLAKEDTVNFNTKSVEDECGFRVIPRQEQSSTKFVDPDDRVRKNGGAMNVYYPGKQLIRSQPEWVYKGRKEEYFLGANNDAWSSFKIKKIYITKECVSRRKDEVRFSLKGKRKCSEGAAFKYYTQLWLMATRQDESDDNVDKTYYFCYELLPDWDTNAVLRITPLSANHEISLGNKHGRVLTFRKMKKFDVSRLNKWRDIRDITDKDSVDKDYVGLLKDRGVWGVKDFHDNSSLQKFHEVLIKQLKKREFINKSNFRIWTKKTAWNNQTFCQLWEMYFGVYESKWACYTKRQRHIQRRLYGEPEKRENGGYYFEPRDDRVPIITSKEDLKKLSAVSKYYERKAAREREKNRKKNSGNNGGGGGFCPNIAGLFGLGF